jgi:Asp-tRNA(Asn)/Glu-tRNA(Gln) amidotransferase A subunit family amidase
MKLLELSASAAVAAIDAGQTSSVELVQAYIDQINAHEEVVGAWAHFDAPQALAQARVADKLRKSGARTGLLQGIPVGVKDVFDTHDYPTEDGSIIHKGRTPAADAGSVEFLRKAGAIIMGKTVTTEFAYYSPGKTKNPLDATRTPGGSSSGSAAAVAANMVPLAIGTQTNGSVIRPASFCGVVGFKPSYGSISRHRTLLQSLQLDQVGIFARDVGDAALMAEALMQYDPRDPSMRTRMAPKILELIKAGPLVPPRLAFIKTPAWEQADADVQEGFSELVSFLGEAVEEIDLTHLLEDVYEWHKIIMEADIAKNFKKDYFRSKEAMSPVLRELIERGNHYLAVDYNVAIEHIKALNAAMDEIMSEYDAILTPATLGEAPVGLDSTGSPIFCTPWTFCGMPSVTLPLLQGSNNMPIGVQLVSEKGDDARLLRTADWLTNLVTNEA